jgi:hypothetical protein
VADAADAATVLRRETLMSFKVKQWGYASGDRYTTVVIDFVELAGVC